LRDNSPSFSSKIPICSLSPGASIAKSGAISAASGSGNSKRSARSPKCPLLPVGTRKPSRLTIACASVTHRARVRTRLSRTVSNARTWRCSSEV